MAHEAAHTGAGCRRRGTTCELRQRAGDTQAALAEKLDMTVQYLRRVESGRVNLSVESLVRFARALGVEPCALLDAPADRSKPKRGRPPGAGLHTVANARATSAKRRTKPRHRRLVTTPSVAWSRPHC